ncbi:HAD family acid phosphatase [Mycoplasmopsis verecunda]|uniref:Predicted secreted acid phosphatase n=1 Tax=Mycoplasmopsis verecunda TaxID=171291 RepID=A0A1T4LQ22_9BACT|nr:HAD family acid phosphatase [Mycoplasmopsis verecunda]WPB54545.1 HAD family acid phosphatase [Mycoplasmopsis verecunda]SJZ56736.1 Predicted secreted acid phosphatase [Mycoplasmopsis verecunda]
MNKISKYLLATGGLATLVVPTVAASCDGSELEKKDNEIKELKEQLSQLQNSKDQQTTSLNQLNQKVAELEQIKKTIGEQLKALQEQGRSQDVEAINSLKAEKTELDKKIKALEKERNNIALASSNLWNSVSGEKHIMGQQVYASAKRLFDKMVTQENVELDKVKKDGEKVTVEATSEGKFIPVVFMDIDETVLNNFKYQNYLMVNRLNHSSKLFTEYINKAISTEVNGAIDFIKHVWSKGGVVMFNSNRTQTGSNSHVEKSKENIVKLGLEPKLMPEWIWWMRGDDRKQGIEQYSQTNKSPRISKEERMHWINTHKLTIDGKQAQFKVVMRVGDDISDFNDNYTKQPKQISSKELVDTMKDSSVGYGVLFGNDSLDNKSIYYNPKTNKWEKEDFAASYVLIPGNSSHGSWINQALNDYFDLQKVEELLKKDFMYTPDSK